MPAHGQFQELPHPNTIKHLPPDEQVIHAHFEAEGDRHWYVAGQYPDPRYMFGFVDLGHEQGGEWGDFPVPQLLPAGALLDSDWTPKPFSEIK